MSDARASKGGLQDSLWAANIDFIEYPSLNDPIEVDVAIVGAGITGTSTALHATKKSLSVAVLEAQQIGSEASGRNGGFVVPNFAKVDPDDVVRQLGEKQGERLNQLIGGSADFVYELIRRYNIDCDAVQGGWIQPAHAISAIPGLMARCKQWADRNRPVELLDRTATLRVTGCRDYAASWLDRSGGTLHPLKYVHGLARAAHAAGASIYCNSRVTQIRRVNQQWHLTTPQGSVLASQVLLCTNAHANSLWPKLARSVVPVTVHQIATAPLTTDDQEHLLAQGCCLTDTANNLFSYRLDTDGRLISGGMAIIQFGARRRLAKYIAQRLARKLDLKTVPSVEFAWSGKMAITPDFLPRLYSLAPGMIAGIGCNGRGIAMSTVLGRLLADAAAGAPESGLPLTPGKPKPLWPHGVVTQSAKLVLAYGRCRDFAARYTGGNIGDQDSTDTFPEKFESEEDR